MADANNPWGRKPASPPRPPRRWGLIANVAVFTLLAGYVVADMGRDLMRPSGFSFLRDLYLKPALTAKVRRDADGAATVAVAGDIAGSRLGVHRFRMEAGGDGVGAAQRMMGAILAYLDEMGVKPSLAEATTRSDSIRWLTPVEAKAMDLVGG